MKQSKIKKYKIAFLTFYLADVISLLLYGIFTNGKHSALDTYLNILFLLIFAVSIILLFIANYLRVNTVIKSLLITLLEGVGLFAIFYIIVFIFLIGYGFSAI